MGEIESNKICILYLDDEEMNLDGFYYSFNDEFEIIRAQTPDEAFAVLNSQIIHVIITDQRMPAIKGTEFIKKVKDKYSDIQFIILTAYSDVDTMLEAINELNVIGFVPKPYDVEEMRRIINNAYEKFCLITDNKLLIKAIKEKNKSLHHLQLKLETENIILKQKINNETGDIITNNIKMKEILRQIKRAAEVDAPVLIQGKTGTGKELIAQALHELSNRRDKPLITINCSAIPENLIESELFGHEKGAFTGAIKSKPGRFELAHKGTLFLDEIGELPVHTQPKLLRALQQGEIMRVGGIKTIKIDARIIAATSRDLKTEIKIGHFREDLYYRLNVFLFNIPSLHERTDDISLLVEYFSAKYNKKYNKYIEVIPKKLISKLESYSWPGNIRELENVVERGVITSVGKVLIIEGISENTENEKIIELVKLIDIEKAHITKILKKTQWKIRGDYGASALLDVKPTTLHSKIKKLGINKNDTF